MLNKHYLPRLNQKLLSEAGVLALVSFEPNCSEPSQNGVIPVGFEPLSGKGCEVIRYGDSVAERGTTDACHWNIIDDVCCIATWVQPEGCEDTVALYFDAYMRLFRVLRDMGFPHAFRAWNFMPGINVGDADQETYKQFCLGRHRAFEQLGLKKVDYPAASALGHHGQGAVVYVLASNHLSEHIENPRQESAYEYPRQYGPSSPSFARATQIELAGSHHVFVSGTASIIGHQTVAKGDINEQLYTSVENIKVLISQKGLKLSDLTLVRVYLRYVEHFEYTENFLKQWFSADQVCVLWSDICRSNLLVEIEAVALSVE